MKFAIQIFTLLITGTFLGGCTTVSGSGNFKSGDEVRAEVLETWTAAAFEKELSEASTPQEREALRRIIGPAVQAGRAIQYRCAQGDNAMIIGNGILPAGMTVRRGEVVLISVGDSAGSIPNKVIGKPSSTRLQRGSFHRPGKAVSITPWASYWQEAPVEPWVEAEYARTNRTTLNFLIRCRAPA